MEIQQIYKEYSLRKIAKLPKKKRLTRRKYKDKKTKTTNFGQFDRGGYMPLEEPMASTSTPPGSQK